MARCRIVTFSDDVPSDKVTVQMTPLTWDEISYLYDMRPDLYSDWRERRFFNRAVRDAELREAVWLMSLGKVIPVTFHFSLHYLKWRRPLLENRVVIQKCRLSALRLVFCITRYGVDYFDDSDDSDDSDDGDDRSNEQQFADYMADIRMMNVHELQWATARSTTKTWQKWHSSVRCLQPPGILRDQFDMMAEMAERKLQERRLRQRFKLLEESIFKAEERVAQLEKSVV
jgi:hypothetical protein